MLMVLFAAILFSSCTKDSEQLDPTTLTVTNNTDFYDSGDEYLNGSLYEVIVFTYIGDNVSGQISIDDIAYGGGSIENIELPDKTEKVRLSFKMLPPESPFYDNYINFRRYTVSYYYIDVNKKNQVLIDGSTMMTGTLKSTEAKADIEQYFSDFIKELQTQNQNNW